MDSTCFPGATSTITSAKQHSAIRYLICKALLQVAAMRRYTAHSMLQATAGLPVMLRGARGGGRRALDLLSVTLKCGLLTLEVLGPLRCLSLLRDLLLPHCFYDLCSGRNNPQRVLCAQWAN